MSEEPEDKKYVILANGQEVCRCTGKQNAKLVSNCLYHMRGFFSKGFEEVTIYVEDEK